MPQFYVPARVKAEKAAHALMPHSEPMNRLPHFDRENQATAYLNSIQSPVPYYGMAQPGLTEVDAPAMTFGPNNKLEWPVVETIYRVEITSEEKMLDMANNTKDFSGIGKFGQTTLNPASVLSRTTTIHPDALHEKAWVDHFEPSLGQHLEDQHIAEQLLLRGADLQRLYRILERSGPREREELDLDNPVHMEIMRKLCVYDPTKPVTGTLEDRTMQTVLRQIGAEVGVRTALELSKAQIEIKFRERLEAQPPETPPAERVAVAMTETLQAFASSVPGRDSSVIAKVASQVKGTINDLSQETRAARITEFELGALPDELRPAWAKVSETMSDEEKDAFIEEFNRQREQRAELDEAADRAVFAATASVMASTARSAGNIIEADALDEMAGLDGPVFDEDEIGLND